MFAGLKPGTVVVSEKVVNAELEPVYKTVSSESSQINIWTKIAIEGHKTNQEYLHWAKQLTSHFSREYQKEHKIACRVEKRAEQRGLDLLYNTIKKSLRYYVLITVC